jgi:hypothetical protein
MSPRFSWFRRREVRVTVAALALLGFSARALMPVGFMPQRMHGETRLVLCPMGSMHASLHEHAKHPGTSSSADTPCVYAASGGAAPLPTVLHIEPALAIRLLRAQPSEQGFLSPPAWRHHAPRGPPALA